MDLLTLIAFEGYSQREVAEIRGIAPAAICKKIAKLKNFCMGVNFARFRCLPSEGIILKTKEQRNMNHLNEKNSVLNRPMYLCLCPVCLGQFLDTGIYKIVRENHGQAKERCDFCNYRNGYDFIIYSKAEKKDEVADEWQ